MYMKDPKTKDPSVTLTLLIVGFAVCLLKLLTSGMIIGTIHLGDFAGSDFAECIGALGALYAARKHSDNMTINNTTVIDKTDIKE